MAHTTAVTTRKLPRRDFAYFLGTMKTSKKYNRIAARRAFIKDILSGKNSVKV